MNVIPVKSYLEIAGYLLTGFTVVAVLLMPAQPVKAAGGVGITASQVQRIATTATEQAVGTAIRLQQSSNWTGQ